MSAHTVVKVVLVALVLLGLAWLLAMLTTCWLLKR